MSNSYRNILSYKIFFVFNAAFIGMVTILCVLPFIHILAVSFSSAEPTNANLVKLWPIGFNVDAYKDVIRDAKLLVTLTVSIKRTLLGVAVNMLLTVIAAYPLSFDKEKFPLRNMYLWIILFTMLFYGGLIPTYILIKNLGLINNIWSLILPGIPVFNVIILINFFRQLPKEILESAEIDGARHWTVLLKLYIPLSLPAIATLVLFCTVGHWNSWFDGLIYMTDTKKYPLQTYLQALLLQTNSPVSLDEAKRQEFISRRSIISAKLMVGIVPILLVYPYLQKYYRTGLVLGAVKG